MRFVLFLFAAAVLWGQSDGALRTYFEGKYVRTKIDLPGTHNGLDVYYRRQPPMDLRTYQSRLNEWGAAVQAGSDIMVTTVRVKGKNIEFQLGGGGLNESASVDFPTNVPKSRYEEDLERDIRKETDSRRRDSMRREVDRLRSRRDLEERRLRAEKTRLEAMKQRELREKAYRYGSRINIWFDKDYLKESIPRPEDLMRMLDEWVDFSPMTGMRRPAPGSGGIPSVVPLPLPSPHTRSNSTTALKRGMEASEVHRLMGKPERYKESKEGSLTSRTEAFEIDSETVEVDYVEGLVVRWRVSSK